VAAIVGYITNFVGVYMLFYPLKWRGLSLLRYSNQPFGWIGWQGVVPAKRTIMAGKLLDFTISKLVSISEVFGRLDATRIALLLSPAVQPVILSGCAPLVLLRYFLQRVTAKVITNIESFVDMRGLVVSGLSRSPATLGSFFQRVGGKELSFLVTSGSYFGFALGLLQMAQMVFYPRNWTLPVGGALVGYITNWIALKLIFEPVNPVNVGPFVLQGLFLRRQQEVSIEFSTYISEQILTSQAVWQALLQAKNAAHLRQIIRANVPCIDSVTANAILRRLRAVLAVQEMPSSLTVLSGLTAAQSIGTAVHRYTNECLGLRALLIERMSKLSPQEFVQVLRPIFQEDEVILIAAGGVLGALAGGVQWWVNVQVEKRRKPGLPVKVVKDARMPGQEK
jgi:uncharacterized membrane protein YheB (UPF0754 family)